MTEAAPSVALLTRQITHYHHPRFAAAARSLSRLDVISVANEGKFSQVLAQQAPEGYQAHRLFDTLQDYRAAVKQRALTPRIDQTLDAIAPDVVAISGWASPESYAALSWARARAKGVVVMSDSRAIDAPRNGFRDWIKGRVVRACDAGLAAGEVHKNYLCDLGLPRSVIRLGYDVVDNAYFRKNAALAIKEDPKARRALDLPRSYILASARFVQKKNLSALIEGYGQACAGLSAPPDLVIAGEGEERAALQRLASSLVHGNVHLPGLYAYRDLPALYGLAEGFVHIPTSEQWGLVVNEAAASGAAMVISKQCGAAHELVQHGKNGWLVSADSIEEIAAGLREMMSLSVDEKALKGRASQDIVANWGPERFAAGLSQAAIHARGSHKSLSLLDRLIIKVMSRLVVETVE